MINQLSISRIVLLMNDLASTHAVRQAVRRGGLTVILDPVSSREEFLSRFRNGSVDMILAPASGYNGMEVSEIIDQTRSGPHEIPLILLGSDGDASGALQAWRGAATDIVKVSEFDRLPSILARALRDSRTHRVNASVQGELDRAAEILRENQKLITIGRLTASIAHEINNPLESITNLLYLMEAERNDPNKWKQYLTLAQRELSRVVQISKQTLTFSRETTVPVRVQLSELIEEVVALYHRKISEKNLRILRQYESAEQVSVFPGEMRQVLSNLIANAIEATSAGGLLKFRIRSARNWSDQGVQGIRVSVADDGSGMSAEVRHRLGQPFFTTKGQHGTGLGLWVTRAILSRYGGNLQLRSSTSPERHGTVFSMFLPTNMRPLAVIPRGGASPSPVGESTRQGSAIKFSRTEGERNDSQRNDSQLRVSGGH